MLQFNKFDWIGIIIGQLVPQGCFSLSVVIIPNNFLTFHFLASTGYWFTCWPAKRENWLFFNEFRPKKISGILGSIPCPAIWLSLSQTKIFFGDSGFRSISFLKSKRIFLNLQETNWDFSSKVIITSHIFSLPNYRIKSIRLEYEIRKRTFSL